MLGNVEEWTGGAAYKRGYPPGPLVDLGAELTPDQERPIRGGFVGSNPARAAVSNRLTDGPNGRHAGFRLARSLAKTTDAGTD